MGTYVSHVTQPPSTQAFVDKYHFAFTAAPDEYAAAAYACVQVIVQALREVAKIHPTAGNLREALRALAVRPNQHYQTVVSDVAFDENGDNVHQYVTFYRVDPSTQGGKGDWVIAKQQDYAPAP